MNIKGHAVVELRDVETGEIQRIEHDNMVTNGLKYCLTPWLGKFSYATGGASPQVMSNESEKSRKSQNRSIMNHLLGGIFLFQNNLEENVDNVAFPLDNPLTGKASWDAYSGSDTYRGSYNEKESGLQDDGSYKQVWDFATSQANGQISAIALTTYKGGICGCGFKEWDSTETAIEETPYFEVGKININQLGEGGYCTPMVKPALNEIYYVADPYYLTYDSRYADRHLGNAGKILFKKKKFPLTRLSPFYDYYNQLLTEDVEVEVPEEFTAYANRKICRGKCSDNYLYIYNNDTSYVKSQESFKLLRIRKSDLGTEVITLTNSSEYKLIINDICFTDELCFFPSSDNQHVVAIGIKDNELTVLELNTKGEITRVGDYIYTNRSNTDNFIYCINTKTLEAVPFPWTQICNNSGTWDGHTEKLIPNVCLRFFYGNNSSTARNWANIYISANTLMTINNLPSPVVKTAAQTMKVTYTIQETEV